MRDDQLVQRFRDTFLAAPPPSVTADRAALRARQRARRSRGRSIALVVVLVSGGGVAVAVQQGAGGAAESVMQSNVPDHQAARLDRGGDRAVTPISLPGARRFVPAEQSSSIRLSYAAALSVADRTVGNSRIAATVQGKFGTFSFASPQTTVVTATPAWYIRYEGVTLPPDLDPSRGAEKVVCPVEVLVRAVDGVVLFYGTDCN